MLQDRIHGKSDMTSQIIPVDPFDFIVFGGTGDLAERKLLPALYQRQLAGQFCEPTRIIGASRAKLSDKEYRDFAREAITDHVDARRHRRRRNCELPRRLHYVSADGTTGAGFDDTEDGARRRASTHPRLLSGGRAVAVRRDRRPG